MEKIDWSKAPEGATHWMQESSEWLEGFWKRVGTANYFYEKGEWVFSGGKPFGHPKLIARPSAAWSGDGLPPVGVRCEAAIPHTSGSDNERSFIWIEGSVIAYYEIKGKTYAWFAEDDGFYPPNALEFRPIRTPEQIAADEREDAIEEMRVAAGSRNNYPFAELYDAGYRKVDQPK